MQFLHCNTGRRTPTATGLPISAPIPCYLDMPSDGLLDAGFAASRDGRTFDRFDRAPFLPRGPGRPRLACATGNAKGMCPGVWEGAFDAGSTAMAAGIMDRGEEETIMIGVVRTWAGHDIVLSICALPPWSSPNTLRAFRRAISTPMTGT
jgi:hypothetical protein